jgi:hypothetical protein
MSGDLIPGLRTRVRGRVIGPDDTVYDETRAIMAGGYDRRPSVIVRPADARDAAHVDRRTIGELVEA